MRYHPTLSAIPLLLLLAALPRAEHPAGAEAGRDPLAVFEDVAEAWRNGDAARIEPHIGRRGVRLSFAPRMPAGRYSANQALYLLERLLEEPETVRFAYLRYRHLDGGGGDAVPGGRPSGVAERIRIGPDGAPEREMIFVSLVREEGRWRVGEIRGTPGPEREMETR